MPALFRFHGFLPVALGAAAAALGAPAAFAAPSVAELAAQADWRAAIEHVTAPTDGCYAATFPTRGWHRVACVAAPAGPFLPRGLTGRSAGRIVGNGYDYAAVTATPTKAAVGAFPVVKGLTSETGARGANDYSLQLNTGFMNTAGCQGGASGCQTWQQFIYASGYRSVFMQYWLLGYNNACPSGWNSYSGDCYKNSAAVSAPQVAATELHMLKVKGSAKAGGNDTVTFVGPTSAYSTSGPDTVVYLAGAWTQSEFNVVGDGGGSQANFNTGTSLTVSIRLNDGSTAAPQCAANSGTTGETNNLNLGVCTAVSALHPAIHFVEKN